MGLFQNGLKAKVMSTELVMEADVSKKILFEALERVKNFESTFSAYKEESLLNTINRSAGVQPVSCNEFELELFRSALDIAKRSEGKFDPTIGVLTQGLYGFGKENQKIPTQKELEKRKKLVDYKSFVIDGKEVYLAKKGMRLDLGGIAKGFLAEKLVEFFRQNGAKRVMVNVGGELCLYGRSYHIAIKNPYSDTNVAVIKTMKKPLSISTSGDYERYIKTKEHHHILDSKMAKQNHFYSSITVLKNGIEGTLIDAVATIAFNSQPKELRAIAQRFGIALIAIPAEGSIVFENFSNLDIESIELFGFF